MWSGKTSCSCAPGEAERNQHGRRRCTLPLALALSFRQHPRGRARKVKMTGKEETVFISPWQKEGGGGLGLGVIGARAAGAGWPPHGMGLLKHHVYLEARLPNERGNAGSCRRVL